MIPISAQIMTLNQLIRSRSVEVGAFPTLMLGLPSLAALAADVCHLCNLVPEARIRRFGNTPASACMTCFEVQSRNFLFERLWGDPFRSRRKRTCVEQRKVDVVHCSPLTKCETLAVKLTFRGNLLSFQECNLPHIGTQYVLLYFPGRRSWRQR